MAEQRVRRRRRGRRRSSTAGRETARWLSLIILGVKKSYHWVVLALLVTMIMMSGYLLTLVT